ncbi:MAG: hypothetical protein IH616_09990 [Gemmatimonadales bacterium]|nr:hypothetical protein [Gemmatimonadales bacterium]
MQTPEFFDEVPPIVLIDPLADLLGAADEGLLEYRYVDVVKAAGHSCPTVAGAWLMTRKALAHLYPGTLPRRGEIRVELRRPLEDGVVGVIGAVAGFITGAANEGGFKGLGGRFARQGLLRFGVPMEGEIRFARVDTGAAIELDYRPQAVPRPDALASVMPPPSPQADAARRRAFGAAWQDWVRSLLLDHAEDPALIEVRG